MRLWIAAALSIVSTAAFLSVPAPVSAEDGFPPQRVLPLPAAAQDGVVFELGGERAAGGRAVSVEPPAPPRAAPQPIPPKMEDPSACAQVAADYESALGKLSGPARGFGAGEDREGVRLLLQELHHVHERFGCNPWQIYAALRRWQPQRR